MPSVNVIVMGTGERISGLSVETVGELKSVISEELGMPVDMQCISPPKNIPASWKKKSLKQILKTKKSHFTSWSDDQLLASAGVKDGDELTVSADMDGGVIVLGVMALLACLVIVAVGASFWIVSGITWVVTEGIGGKYRDYKEKRKLESKTGKARRTSSLHMFFYNGMSNSRNSDSSLSVSMEGDE